MSFPTTTLGNGAQEKLVRAGRFNGAIGHQLQPQRMSLETARSSSTTFLSSAKTDSASRRA
jgi:hypothetical protein